MEIICYFTMDICQPCVKFLYYLTVFLSYLFKAAWQDCVAITTIFKTTEKPLKIGQITNLLKMLNV